VHVCLSFPFSPSHSYSDRSVRFRGQHLPLSDDLRRGESVQGHGLLRIQSLCTTLIVPVGVHQRAFRC
jgi:hypothetical protein